MKWQRLLCLCKTGSSGYPLNSKFNNIFSQVYLQKTKEFNWYLKDSQKDIVGFEDSDDVLKKTIEYFDSLEKDKDYLDSDFFVFNIRDKNDNPIKKYLLSKGWNYYSYFETYLEDNLKK